MLNTLDVLIGFTVVMLVVSMAVTMKRSMPLGSSSISNCCPAAMAP